MKDVAPFYYNEEGRLVINMAYNEADADWIRAARLKEKALAGDQDAAKELEIMENTPMFQLFGEVEEADEWTDPRMTKEEWDKIITDELDAKDKRRFWYSIHTKRSPDVIKDHFSGLPIGLLVLDNDVVRAYYLKGFEDEHRFILQQLDSDLRKAGDKIRIRFDNPDMYGDWWSLDETTEKFNSSDDVGKHYLDEFKKFWE